MNVQQAKDLVANAKELKTLAFQRALKAEDDEKAGETLLLAESLAMAECHAQCALVRLLRMEKQANG